MDCGGTSICQHNRRRSDCKDCGGTGICPHDRQWSRCKDCGDTSTCPHNRRVKSQGKDWKRRKAEHNVNKYRDIMHVQTLIESRLPSQLTEHLNSEIVLRSIKDIESMLCWASSIFLMSSSVDMHSGGASLASAVYPCIMRSRMCQST